MGFGFRPLQELEDWCMFFLGDFYEDVVPGCCCFISNSGTAIKELDERRGSIPG